MYSQRKPSPPPVLIVLFIILILASLLNCASYPRAQEPTPTCITMGGTVLTTRAACDSARAS